MDAHSGDVEAQNGAEGTGSGFRSGDLHQRRDQRNKNPQHCMELNPNTGKRTDEGSVVDTDPDWIGLNGIPGSVSRSRRAKITHKNRKKLIHSFFEVPDVLF